MAPLGVVTIMMAAVRADSRTWLKSIIGRSRETLEMAEMEVMSSTSKVQPKSASYGTAGTRSGSWGRLREGVYPSSIFFTGHNACCHG